MSLLYNLFLGLVDFLLPIIRFFSSKAEKYVIGQKNIPFVLNQIKDWKHQYPNRPIIWFHCASLGEFEQGRPILEEFKKRNPSYGVCLTFFSPSGYEVRKNYALADFISYLPIDTPSKTRTFVQTIKPEIVVFVKYEFWPNVLREIKRSHACLVGVSVILRADQAFFKPWGRFFRKILQSFDFLFVQNKASAELLGSINFTNYEIAGDSRFDRVLATATDQLEVKHISEFIGEAKTMVVGSAWQEDIALLKPFISQHSEMKFIIAPHEIKSEQISVWAKDLNAQRYSEISNLKPGNVLIIDSIGLLAHLYRYANYAFVGGGFRTGLHNILEPAVFGIPIFFGNKKYQKFQEAIDLLELGVAFAIDQDLETVFGQLNLNEIKQKAANYIQENAGATQKILTYLEK